MKAIEITAILETVKQDPDEGVIPKGTKRWFEYHCYEGHDSADAELWYHSHQKVVVGKCYNPEDAMYPRQQRIEDGPMLTYQVKFPDGFVGDAVENELCLSRSEFERPDPPDEDEIRDMKKLQKRLEKIKR
jgi:hypothetical protein